MRAVIALFVLLIWTAAVARVQPVVYVAYSNAEPAFEIDTDLCPLGPGGGYVGYLGTRKVCADALLGPITNNRALVESRIDEAVLLTSRPGGRTLYRVRENREPIFALANLIRRPDEPLVVRGQTAEDGTPLVWFRGLDLIDTICAPGRVLEEVTCRAGMPSAGAGPDPTPFDRRYELTSLAAVDNAQFDRARSNSRQGFDLVTSRSPRSYCIRMSQVAGIVLADLGFEDCWIAAIHLVNASDITVTGARIHGSTFGVIAIATEGMELGSHTFRVLSSHWIQSPAAYRNDADRPCENPHLDLSCPLDVWDDIPWGVTHHHLWRPLNGALFAGYNIAGNVLIEGNTLERAYNGIRIVSEFPWTGRNVEVRGNRFRFLRDNAVEPEEHADGWVVRQNVFDNVHAWISSDGVTGGSMYVFGNVGSYDPASMPGQGCSDETDWAASPRLVGMAGDLGRYKLIDVSYDPTSVECRGHYRGVILKTGDKRKSGFPYFERISIFHNSWRTRSPLFSSKHASPLTHFNNAVEFTGCGLDGPWDCRQIPAPLQYCDAGNKRTRGRVALDRFWTDDGGALVADCFSFTPGPAEPDERAGEIRAVDHVFCRDVTNRRFAGAPYGRGACALVVASSIFDDAPTPGPLRRSLEGCAVSLGAGQVVPDCSLHGEPVGAYRADATLFDMDIPGAGFLGAAFRP